MSEEQGDAVIDVVRWTFSINPARRPEVESYLTDLGGEVYVRGEAQFVVIWDEPVADLDAVVDELWGIHGEPFEITHEEFHRIEMCVYHHEDEASEGPEQAVA